MKFTGTFALLAFLLTSVFQAKAQNTPPTANCNGNTIVTPIYENEARSIHAKLFDQNSYDNETHSRDLKFAFSEDPADSLLVLDCNSPESIDITMYVFDEDGEYDFCTAKLNIDHQCDSSPIINGTTDTIAPTIYLIDDIALLTLDSVAFSTIVARDFDAGTYDDVSPLHKLKFSFSPDPEDNTLSYHCFDYPGFDIMIYVTDEEGNQSFSRTSFGIDTTNCGDAFIIDTIPPVVYCHSTLEIELDENGIASLAAKDVNDGSFDGDFTTPDDRLIFSFDLSDKTVENLYFDCEDLGSSERALYVWDYAGNVDSCIFTLMINDPTDFCGDDPVETDTIPPTALCISLLEFQLETDTSFTFTAAQLDNGSEDNETPSDELLFSFSTDTLDTEMTLSCKDLGNNQITLFVTDKEGNVATCVSVVSLLDPDDLCVPEDTTTNITNLADVQWNIYPNPFNESFTIENLPVEKGQIHMALFDVRGQKILSRDISDSKVLIRDNINSGVYFIKLTQNGELIGMHKLTKN